MVDLRMYTPQKVTDQVWIIFPLAVPHKKHAMIRKDLDIFRDKMASI